MFWGRFRPFGYHLSAFPAETENPKIFEILTIWGHFGPFWPPKWPREPQNAGGNRPKWAKRGSTGHKNVFWGRFRPFAYHLSAFPAETENPKIFEILTILGHFGPFLAIFGAILGPFWSAQPQDAPKQVYLGGAYLGGAYLGGAYVASCLRAYFLPGRCLLSA